MERNLISKVVPVYPEIAKAAHVQGVVVLHAMISKTGDVENLSVISGSPMLTASAIDAVKQWKYNPYLLNGQPRDVETTINVHFTLAESASPVNGAGASVPVADCRAEHSLHRLQGPELGDDPGGRGAPEPGRDRAQPWRLHTMLRGLPGRRRC